MPGRNALVIPGPTNMSHRPSRQNLNELMILTALTGSEMALRDVSIRLALRNTNPETPLSKPFMTQ